MAPPGSHQQPDDSGAPEPLPWILICAGDVDTEQACQLADAVSAALTNALCLLRGKPFESRDFAWADAVQQEMISRIVDRPHSRRPAHRRRPARPGRRPPRSATRTGDRRDLRGPLPGLDEHRVGRREHRRSPQGHRPPPADRPHVRHLPRTRHRTAHRPGVVRQGCTCQAHTTRHRIEPAGTQTSSVAEVGSQLLWRMHLPCPGVTPIVLLPAPAEMATPRDCSPAGMKFL